MWCVTTIQPKACTSVLISLKHILYISHMIISMNHLSVDHKSSKKSLVSHLSVNTAFSCQAFSTSHFTWTLNTYHIYQRYVLMQEHRFIWAEGERCWSKIHSHLIQTNPYWILFSLHNPQAQDVPALNIKETQDLFSDAAKREFWFLLIDSQVSLSTRTKLRNHRGNIPGMYVCMFKQAGPRPFLSLFSFSLSSDKTRCYLLNVWLFLMRMHFI